VERRCTRTSNRKEETQTEGFGCSNKDIQRGGEGTQGDLIREVSVGGDPDFEALKTF